MSIIGSYIPVVIFLIVALAVPPVLMFIVYQLSPRSKAAAKLTTYECGSVPIGDAKVQFNIEYYLYAIAFVIFDIEILFMYPWAMVYIGHGITNIAVVAMLLFFIVSVLIGDLYMWKKGAFKWVK